MVVMIVVITMIIKSTLQVVGKSSGKLLNRLYLLLMPYNRYMNVIMMKILLMIENYNDRDNDDKDNDDAMMMIFMMKIAIIIHT